MCNLIVIKLFHVGAYMIQNRPITRLTKQIQFAYYYLIY